MPTVNDTVIRKRVVALLLANRASPYAGTVGTGSSTNSRYQSDAEITDAMLEADAQVCLARMSNPGDPFRETWMTVASGLANGDRIPAFTGAVGDVDVDAGSGHVPAKYASSRMELIEIGDNPTLYPDADKYCFVEDGRVFHNAVNARVHYPSFIKSTVCQSPEADEAAVIAGTVSFLVKDGSSSPELFAAMAAYFQAYLAMLRGEEVLLPKVEQFERMAA